MRFSSDHHQLLATIKKAHGILIFFLVFFAISGCMRLGPDFETPEAEISDDWIDAEEAGFTAGEADYSGWWKSFNDPVLESLVEQAYQENNTLQVAGLRVYEARAILGVAVGNLYPQEQSLGGSVSKTRISKTGEPFVDFGEPLQNQIGSRYSDYRVGLDATWELDFWGRFRRSVESADANLSASIATYDDVLVTLTGEVAAAYISLRTLEELLDVARFNVAVQTRGYEIADVRNRNQLTTELDPVVARAFLRNTEATIPELEAAIRQTKNALCVLLGKPPGALNIQLDQDSSIPLAPVEVVLGAPAELLRRRPDIRQAEASAASQSARIGIAKAEMYPSFALTGSIGYAAGTGSDVFDSDSLRGLAFVGFRWNILNYGRIKNLVRVEDARFQQSIEQYQDTVIRAAREVEDATASYVAARQQVVLLEDGVVAAERAVELSFIQYRDGTADYTRVLDAQRFQLQQQNGLTKAKGRVGRSLVALYKSLGGGWESRSLDELIPADMKQQMQERTKWGKLLDAKAVEPVAEQDRGDWRLPD